MEDRIKKLESEMEAVKLRNARVEADKAWESSWIRIGLLTLLTYLAAALVLRSIGAENFLFASLVPAAGFFLSVQTLPVLKRWWIKKYYIPDRNKK